MFASLVRCLGPSAARFKRADTSKGLSAYQYMVIVATTIEPHLIRLQRECRDDCLVVTEDVVNESWLMSNCIEVYLSILNVYKPD